jgi:hypothetical protein
MIRTQIYLTEEERAALKRLAEERGTSQSALIREAVDLFLAARGTEPEEKRLDESFGIWTDRENIHETFRAIRASMDRDVWARVESFHENDEAADNG